MSGDHNDYLWDHSDDEEFVVEVHVSIKSHGVTSRLYLEKPDECTWQEIVDPVIRHLEGHWGYPLDLNKESFEGVSVGLWYPGKNDAE